MMKKNLIHTLAASVMLAATAGLTTSCTDNDDRSALPLDPVENPTPGGGEKNPWENVDLTFDLGTAKIGLKKVEGGTYSMQYERDGQTQTVTGTLSDYYIAPVELTNGTWAAVMGAKPAGQTNDGDMYPVSNVSYEDITREGGFLDRLNAMVKDQLPEGMTLQLPTEAQWHYAAQGGQKSKGYTYAGSNTLSDVAWYVENADGTTHPVASKQPNELGLYDMSGNVWEYCSDWWADTADLPAEQGTDYAGPTSGTLRVNLGGSFKSAASSMPIMLRDYLTPDTPVADKVISRGLRLVLAAPSDNYSATDSAPAAAEAVDLGLPSGTKWANMNVGAEAPEDYGLYFAWGETVGYTSDTSDGHEFNWALYKWMNEGESDWQQINKYQRDDDEYEACWYQFNGNTGDYEFIGDSKMVLDPEDDAAHINWSGKWRMPTAEEFEELLTNTTAEWTTQGGVNGYKFTSKTNGNSIFLPAAGYRAGSSLYGQSTDGNYWSSLVYHSYTLRADCLVFDSNHVSPASASRANGRSVRPVQ